MPRKPTAIRTFAQARAFVRRVGICGIFSEIEGHSLWSVTDLPTRQPGEKGHGQRVNAVWTWKSELPFRHPDEFFYGKIPGGLAALMTLDRLRTHYAVHHRLVEECSPLAQKIYRLLRLDPLTSTELRRELDMTHAPEKARHDRAVLELQTTLNICRRNALHEERDTWVPFREQYLDIVRSHESIPSRARR